MKKFKHVNSGKIPFYRMPGCQMGTYVEQKAYCETAALRSCAHKSPRKQEQIKEEY